MKHTLYELDFYGDPPKLYCPVCGKPAVTSRIKKWCPHTLFVHCDLGGDFMYVAPHLKRVVAKVERELEDEDGSIFPDLIKKIDSSSILFLSVTSMGVCCCGPVSCTLTAAFDFNPKHHTVPL